MDFFQIKERPGKAGAIEIYPDFKVCRSKDLMVRGRSFYAVWDKEKHLWSTDEYDVQRLVDNELMKYKEDKYPHAYGGVQVKLMSDFSSNSWSSFKNYVNHISDNAHSLDCELTFSNKEVKKTDYVSKKLPYPLEKGDYSAFDELIGTLYTPEERAKLEWSIGAIVSGDAKDIQKFLVLYGEAGAGKSTILNIIQKLFTGYYTAFEAKALTASSNAFATEVFKSNPLVAIQHDGDLSRIEDNTKLNSIVSHEEMTMNEKYKPSYMARVNCFLYMGTNKPVKITDAKSGVIRRLIDVKPSGNKLTPTRYQTVMSQIEFELGAIAYHCLEVYREMGKHYYSTYTPVDMMLQTDVFFNFVEAHYHTFLEQNGVSLNQAYQMYKTYCEDSLVEYKSPRYKFREELKNYFEEFHEMTRIDGQQVRSYYHGFLDSKFKKAELTNIEKPKPASLTLDCKTSLIDGILKDCPAQYATKNGTPTTKWDSTPTTLGSINTKKLHFVKVPENHIVIDFDLKDDNGKSAELNLEAASKWPPTYAEFSKSGAGVHLHYIFNGDVNNLSRVHSDGIEIKVFTGNSSLRRQLSLCNDIPIATINSGLPLKGEKMINFETVKSEKALRAIITKNLNKEVHPGTKPSIDFIHKILEDAYESGAVYDLTDMRPSVLTFANDSSNQADYCVKLVGKMKFKSEDTSEPLVNPEEYISDEIVFFDVEVFPNLFVIVWKMKDKQPVKMINPSAKDIEPLLKMKLVGFNCRRYDNHILYGRYIGMNNEQLYNLSQRIVNGSPNAMFREAYNLSYTDIYDFASAGNKKSLKKFEIELGIHHQELGLPWNEPVSEDQWVLVADYCINDVVATEAVFEHLQGDWTARQILAELSGLTCNDTTNAHTTRIIFESEKKPQSSFNYEHLSKRFPGYTYEFGKSSYRGIVPGEGGYVYAEPGIYTNVALLDVASMHPTSIEAMNLFGEYTKRFSDIKLARIYIKQKRFDEARHMLDGRLARYLDDPAALKGLSDALKTAINSVYGLTAAGFENPFRDPRNTDNIVAKRGALFMIDLMFAVQEKGYTVAHIKTDSIKIPDADPEIIDFVMNFGKEYGYEFEHEATYEKMCLVNDAVYIAKYKDGDWTATGAQFGQPYVFKTLFSKEPIEFKDLCETKSVTSSLYLDMNEDLPEDEHAYHFIGKVGSFCPILPGKGGGILLREKDGKYSSATGAKGYRWLEAEMVETLHKEEDIDRSFYNKMVDTALSTIAKYGDAEWFISNN